MKELVSFVIPCYHSELTIRSVVEDIIKTMSDDGRYDCEIVLVNDNPPDETWDVILDICAEHDCVRGYNMTRNFGQHSALMAGYRFSRGDIVVSLDDDGQTPPSEVFKLIDELQGNVDLVYASYPENAHASLFRKIGSSINDKMAEAFVGKPRDVYLSSYLAARRSVVDRVIQYSGPYPYVDGLMLQCCTEVKPVPVKHLDRMSGQSGYSLGKLLSLWLNGFTSFSVKPLRLSTIAGMAFACLGFIAALVIIIQKIVLGDEVSAGWSSLMCLVVIIGGIIMVMIGMTGEYIGRVFISMNKAPQYYIRDSSEAVLNSQDATGNRADGVECSPSQTIREENVHEL